MEMRRLQFGWNPANTTTDEFSTPTIRFHEMSQTGSSDRVKIGVRLILYPADLPKTFKGPERMFPFN